VAKFESIAAKLDMAAFCSFYKTAFIDYLESFFDYYIWADRVISHCGYAYR
jgi:hypothetical protein